jgi:hypothetical protein
LAGTTPQSPSACCSSRGDTLSTHTFFLFSSIQIVSADLRHLPSVHCPSNPLLQPDCMLVRARAPIDHVSASPRLRAGPDRGFRSELVVWTSPTVCRRARTGVFVACSWSTTSQDCSGVAAHQSLSGRISVRYTYGAKVTSVRAHCKKTFRKEKGKKWKGESQAELPRDKLSLSATRLGGAHFG